MMKCTPGYAALPTQFAATKFMVPRRSSCGMLRKNLRLDISSAAGKGFGAPVGFGAPGKATPRAKKKADRPVLLPVWEADKKACPCSSNKPYAECCEPYHNGAVEPTAESLMRARFSAYVKGKLDYVMSTVHPDNPSCSGSRTPDGEHSATLYEDVHATWKRTGWQSLKIMERSEGTSPDEAYVRFIATFKFIGQKGQRQKGTKLETLIEKSRFVRGADSRWLYIDGDTTWSENRYD